MNESKLASFRVLSLSLRYKEGTRRGHTADLNSSIMAQFKTSKLLCLLKCLMAMFKGLQSEQLVFSTTDITFCFNSSLYGQYIHALHAVAKPARHLVMQMQIFLCL